MFERRRTYTRDIFFSRTCCTINNDNNNNTVKDSFRICTQWSYFLERHDQCAGMHVEDYIVNYTTGLQAEHVDIGNITLGSLNSKLSLHVYSCPGSTHRSQKDCEIWKKINCRENKSGDFLIVAVASFRIIEVFCRSAVNTRTGNWNVLYISIIPVSKI